MSFDPTGLDPTAALALLFAGALIASTLIPLQSEALLIAALCVEGVDPTLAVLLAGLGNTLGGHVNWALGRAARRLESRRWFPVSARNLARAEQWHARYGLWSLLLCWVPVIGDPITVAAGALRAPFLTFTAITLSVRLARYAIVAWAFLSI